jgi:hypothetical protein
MNDAGFIAPLKATFFKPGEQAMMKKNLQDAVNEQINQEMYSGYLYLGMAQSTPTSRLSLPYLTPTNQSHLVYYGDGLSKKES